MHTQIKFSVFIITRNRGIILKSTIDAVLHQTTPPSTILIVDNSDNEETELIMRQMNDDRIQYHKVGYNAGPAGGAAIGMKMLFEQGYEWVLWCDDDDPPGFEDIFESQLYVGQSMDKSAIGIVGCVGMLFSRWNGKIKRISDEDLQGVLDVDYVAGNMFPLIHRNVYDRKVLPDAELFFGFEDLDFSLAAKRAGLRIVVSGKDIYRHRELYGRIGLSKKSYTKKQISGLWREYYSVRSMMHILLRKEHAYTGVFFLTIRTIMKAVWGFNFGFRYGRFNFYYLISGLIDGYIRKMGLTVQPVQKY